MKNSQTQKQAYKLTLTSQQSTVNWNLKVSAEM